MGAIPNHGYAPSYSYFIADHLAKAERLLETSLIGIGVHNAMVIDTVGNIIAEAADGTFSGDRVSLAALASANFAAVSAMAKMVGEKQFSLFFHKGKNESIHFSSINDEVLLVVVFGREVSLGILRMNVERVIYDIKRLMKIR